MGTTKKTTTTKATKATKSTKATTTSARAKRKPLRKPRYEAIGNGIYIVHTTQRKPTFLAVRRPSDLDGAEGVPYYIPLPAEIDQKSPRWMIEKAAFDAVERYRHPLKDMAYYVREYVEEKALAKGTVHYLEIALRGFGLDDDVNAIAARRLHEKAVSDGYKNLLMNTASCFYTWLRAKGLPVANPIEGLKVPKRAAPRELTFTASDVERLLADTDQRGTVEDRLYVRLLRFTGARCSTVYALTPKDCERTAHGYSLRLYNVKCDRSYRCRISITDADTVALLDQRIETAKDTLWDTPERALHARLDRRMKRVIGNATPHGLRHFVACELLAKGVDMASISQILDHTSVAVTSAVYARQSQARLDEVLSMLGKNV